MRSSGILMHITSLPGRYGIGTMGREARAFADFLERAGVKYWQILPIGPAGCGNSPYSADSAFAGDQRLIAPEILRDEGLVTEEELSALPEGSVDRVEFAAVAEGREKLLRAAYARGRTLLRQEIDAFYAENRDWLRPYAVYCAARARFGGLPWTEWPEEELRLCRPEALTRYEALWREEIDYHVFVQLLFFRQWDALRAYVNGKGIRIIGDIPIYVPMDSADVWAESRWFRLDESHRPTEVAGVPPDYFSEEGQLWGNPLYDWEALAADGFGWWLRRLRGAARLCDTVRIDHFRGLESFWAVPAGETTAKNGQWRPGPGRAFVDAVKAALPELDIIAEDLGIITPEVTALRDYAGWPGMKVLLFAFDPAARSAYLPHRCGENTVYYTGTHDNETLTQWAWEAPREKTDFAREYLGIGPCDNLCHAVLRAGLMSRAERFIVPMQDWLGYGRDTRMNVPGVVSEDNWCWRVHKEALTDALADRIRRWLNLYER